MIATYTRAIAQHDLAASLRTAAYATGRLVALVITCTLWCQHMAAAINRRLNGEAEEPTPLPLEDTSIFDGGNFQDWLLSVPGSEPKPEPEPEISPEPTSKPVRAVRYTELKPDPQYRHSIYTPRTRKLPPPQGF